MSVDTHLTGSVGDLYSAAAELRRLSDFAASTEDAFAHARGAEWSGEAGTAFRARMAAVVRHAQRVRTHCGESADAVEVFAARFAVRTDTMTVIRGRAAAAGLGVVGTSILSPPPLPELQLAYDEARAAVAGTRRALADDEAELAATLRRMEGYAHQSVDALLGGGSGVAVPGPVPGEPVGSLAIGVMKGTLERYRVFGLSVPRHGTPPLAVDAPRPEVVRGLPVVRRDSGLLVFQGSAADPNVARISSAADSPRFHPVDRPTLVTSRTLGSPPGWATTGARSLGVAGAGVTLYSAYASQWEADALAHPEWDQSQRVISAGAHAAVEGGTALAGALAGAKLGAVLGTFVPIPVVGTVGGAVIGGALGGLLGGWAGGKAGRGVMDAVTGRSAP